MILLLVFAFLAGIVTVLSPCILPILPIILTSTLGGQNIGKGRPMGVVIGFILSFTFFTLFLSTIVRFFGIPSETLRLVSILVILGFGISFLIPQFQVLVEKLFSKLAILLPQRQNRKGFFGGLIIGFSIGLLWTPCVGPILASVISLAITGTVTLDAFLITLSYSIGTAIPMLLIMLSGQKALRKVPWLLKNLGNIQKIFGILMIITAIGIFFNFDRYFQTFILEKFPQYGSGLIKLEDNDLVKRQLEKKDGSTKKEDMGKSMFDFLSPKGTFAPEIIPGGVWFGSDSLTIQSLRGKVILVDFWTYSCINCQRTLPYLRDWYSKYKNKGLVIIGVHAPEFEFEKSEKNVAKAIADFKIAYPVVQDNDFATWRAYDNQYWPAKYFIDREGYIRYTHFGEGAYDESEKVIQDLLKEAGAKDVSSKINNPTYSISSKTPETYLGFGRFDLSRFGSNENIEPNKVIRYSFKKQNISDNVGFEGKWEIMEEYANPHKGAELSLNFDAKEVYLVMKSKDKSSKLKVYLDNKIESFGEDNHDGYVNVNSDRLYKLIKLPNPGRHLIRLEFLDDNCQLFAFTFG